MRAGMWKTRKIHIGRALGCQSAGVGVGHQVGMTEKEEAPLMDQRLGKPQYHGLRTVLRGLSGQEELNW